MARFDMSGLDELIDDMRRMGEMSGEAAPAVLMAGAEAVKLSWQRAADEFDHRVTGDMIESISYARSPRDVGEALIIDIYPQGRDSRGIRNAEKAFILHYGSSKLQGSHWVDVADRYSEETAVPAMEDAWGEFIESGRVPSVAAGGGQSGTSRGITRKRT